MDNENNYLFQPQFNQLDWPKNKHSNIVILSMKGFSIEFPENVCSKYVVILIS